MDNHRYFDDMQIAAFRSGRTYEDYNDWLASIGPTDESSSSMSRADLLSVLLPQLNDLFFPNSDSQEKSE